jgi:Flp pilus assembly protein TadD
VLVQLERAAALADPNDPDQTAPRLLLAETLLGEGQRDAAEKHLQQVFQLDPGNARARYDLGLVAAARADWESARDHFLACLGNPQGRGKAAGQLATVFQRMGDKKNAEFYAGITGRLPRDAQWSDHLFVGEERLDKRKQNQYRIAEEYESEGTPAGLTAAAKIVTHMILEHPEEDLPHLLLGRLLTKIGQFERAEEEVRIALARAPGKAHPYYLLSLILFGRAEKLEQPQLEQPQNKKAEVQNLLEQSATAARQALERTPDNGPAHMALGRALWHLHRKTAAIAAMREAVHCSPEFSQHHLFLGLALVEEGNLTKARPYLEQAQLLAGPKDTRARDALQKHFPTVAIP